MDQILFRRETHDWEKIRKRRAEEVKSYGIEQELFGHECKDINDIYLADVGWYNVQLLELHAVSGGSVTFEAWCQNDKHSVHLIGPMSQILLAEIEYS